MRLRVRAGIVCTRELGDLGQGATIEGAEEHRRDLGTAGATERGEREAERGRGRGQRAIVPRDDDGVTEESERALVVAEPGAEAGDEREETGCDAARHADAPIDRDELLRDLQRTFGIVALERPTRVR